MTATAYGYGSLACARCDVVNEESKSMRSHVGKCLSAERYGNRYNNTDLQLSSFIRFQLWYAMRLPRLLCRPVPCGDDFWS